MKIVHSLWSKPALQRTKKTDTRGDGGWTDKKYNYMSWALSCLQFKKFYDKVELVTDERGYDLLINKLSLPYTKVTVELDCLNGFHHDLWALGKVHAYSIQDEPFIHADGDVYIWSKFDDKLESSSLITQNFEEGFNYYDKVYEGVVDNFDFVPDFMKWSKEKNGQINAINAGIIGGTNLNFFKKYANQVFAFINKNKKCIEQINVGLLNLIFEQYFFYTMAEEEGESISFLLSNVNHRYDGLCELADAPQKVSYTHPIGFSKRSKYIGDLLTYQLQRHHPDYYYKIINLLRSYQI